ncbi:MAG TPA: hypothetical protein VLV86_05715, partial [Vicinamibacterales bacterium]|nr:hypothetical protein [Vicinamibacterales bacterium]
MHIRKWIASIRKPARLNGRSRKSKTPSKLAQVLAVSAVAFVAVAGLVLAAYQATPKAVTPAVATASAQSAERVTITGCLEQTREGYRLKDTEGIDAPRSRTWKTAFLTKHTASVAVVDEKNRLTLANH